MAIDAYKVGGVLTRPAWTAGRKRKNIQPGQGEVIFIEQSYPFYQSYDHYVANLRRKAKGSSIIPEFRISEHLQSYKEQNTMYVAFSGTLSLTGASKDLTSSAQPEFFTRYATSDFQEYLQSFMGYNTQDLQSVSYTHLTLPTNA